jgi:hypothetical protein
MKAAIAIWLSVLLFLHAGWSPASGECPGGDLHYYHDDTFEWGYEWWSQGGHSPPYYGAFAEAYALGTGTVHCGAFWVTQIGYMPSGIIDAYVWDGGITRDPGEVLAVVLGAHLWTIPYWPTVGQNDIEIPVEVRDEFTIGYWLVQEYDDVFTVADHDGPGGHPWTCIAPGLEWPSGWQDARIVWEDVQSFGIGVYFEPDPTPVECSTWGKVKSLFR